MTRNVLEAVYLKSKSEFSEGGKVVKRWQWSDFSVWPCTKICIPTKIYMNQNILWSFLYIFIGVKIYYDIIWKAYNTTAET